MVPGDKDGAKRARLLVKKQKEKLSEETLKLGNHIRNLAESEYQGELSPRTAKK